MKDSNLLYFRFLLNFLDFSAACVIEYRFLNCRRYIRPLNSLLVSGKSPDKDTYTLSFTNLSSEIVAVRIEALPDPSPF